MIKPTAVYQRKKLQQYNSWILFIKPNFKQMLWGGNRLKSDFSYEIPNDHTGECWAVSAHPNGDCQIYTIWGNSPYDGRLLSDLWQNQKELFGGLPGDQFPILLKIIDAKADLSIQVHPNDSYAGIHEDGSLGKTECWLILDCDEDAQIVVGHNARTKEELVQMIEEKRWEDLICKKSIQPGDFFQIEPGMVHAIKAGTLILEIQQSSDITYRLYDYDRNENGITRELHQSKSMDVITCPSRELSDCRELSRQHLAKGVFKEKLVRCLYYDVDRIVIKGSYVFSQQEPFTILCILKGEGMIDGISIKKGDFFILPSGYGEYALTGTLEVIKVVS
ncbi:MAG: mannose-6-phosphate isomerase, class I [Firmicutes bacterium HGW-Firmicutes-7]|nr:MAG: mannose-6-phosphate isomerase, class I [Firmicutes bacterium HGW-Firmicutes-7]